MSEEREKRRGGGDGGGERGGGIAGGRGGGGGGGRRGDGGGGGGGGGEGRGGGEEGEGGRGRDISSRGSMDRGRRRRGHMATTSLGAEGSKGGRVGCRGRPRSPPRQLYQEHRVATGSPARTYRARRRQGGGVAHHSSTRRRQPTVEQAPPSIAACLGPVHDKSEVVRQQSQPPRDGSRVAERTPPLPVAPRPLVELGSAPMGSSASSRTVEESDRRNLKWGASRVPRRVAPRSLDDAGWMQSARRELRCVEPAQPRSPRHTTGRRVPCDVVAKHRRVVAGARGGGCRASSGVARGAPDGGCSAAGHASL